MAVGFTSPSPTKPTNASSVFVSFPDTPSCQRAVPGGRGCEPAITAAFRPHYQVVAPDDLVFPYNGGGLLVPQVTSSPSSSSYH
ncbi:hypothetical protein ZWY2020_057411 [Hordeum vulgare]|nr:hypothetical protein ZWY2020_057411 [Hordeum vulgare]